MKEKLTRIIWGMRLGHPRILAIAGLVVLLIATAASASFMGGKEPAKTTTEKSVEYVNLADRNSIVAVVGGDDSSVAGGVTMSNSWPGEVLSYGNVPVQPEREGTLVEWRVKIGERVGAGQILARLSAPPSTPELVGMLAEKAEGLARARAQMATTERFTEKNKEQLSTLLQAVEVATNGAQVALVGKGGEKTGTARVALDKARSAAVVMRQGLRTMLQQMLARHIALVGDGSTLAVVASMNLNPLYGAIDSQNQNAYRERLINLAYALKDPDVLPVDLATNYFSAFTRLAITSPEDLLNVREMARDDQEKLFDMLAKYRDAEAAVSMKEAEYSLEYADRKREVEEKISENDRMLAMARAEVLAAEAAYAVVNKSITGGLAIVSPQSGIVSTISKKVGDFVGPGMPVASINAESGLGRFVRLRIPSNAQLPVVGTILSVVRPGFSQDVQEVKLTGIGTSLDEGGSYLADATFTGRVDWPVGASVRVMVHSGSSAPVIKLSSVWWSEGGEPHVWRVSGAGRIFAVRIAIGRTLGALIEVYDGIKNGDRYIVNPTPDIREDALLEDIAPKDGDTGMPTTSGEEPTMGGMEM